MAMEDARRYKILEIKYVYSYVHLEPPPQENITARRAKDMFHCLTLKIAWMVVNK